MKRKVCPALWAAILMGATLSLLGTACAGPEPIPYSQESASEKATRTVTDTAPISATEESTASESSARTEALRVARQKVAKGEVDAYYESKPSEPDESSEAVNVGEGDAAERTPNEPVEPLTYAFDPAEHPIVDEVKPAVDSKGCTSVEDFLDYFDARDRNNLTYEYRAAHKKGWKRLKQRVISGRQGENVPQIDRGDDFKDPSGTQWLLIHRSNSCGRFPDAYIDADNNVFIINPDYGGCSRETELKVCGSMPTRGGCGRDPGESLMYVKVPVGATAGPPRSVRLPERRCYSPRATRAPHKRG